MIIRMTVKDNDYYMFLKDFAKDLNDKLCIMEFKSSSDDMRTEICHSGRIRKILSNSSIVSEEDKNCICTQVNKVWQEIVINNQIANEKIKHYLLSNFQVEIVDSFQERCENGEYAYYFSNSNTVIAQ